jgi:hypothetical protein
MARTALLVMLLALSIAGSARAEVTASPAAGAPPPPWSRVPGTLAGAVVGGLIGYGVRYLVYSGGDPASPQTDGLLLGAAVGASTGGLLGWSLADGVEGTLEMGQLAGAAVAAGLVTAVALNMDSDGAVMALLALVPAAGAQAACAIGRFSAFEASCLYSTLGAYAGALAFGAIGYDLATPGQGHDDVLAFTGMGVALGTTVGAMVAWHLTKRPRAQTPAAPTPPLPRAADAWPELRARSVFGAAEPGTRRLMFPVLALTF